MTTPAGWYDDGSGRQRWWDGTQWTSHFAPSAETAAFATPGATPASPGAHTVQPPSGVYDAAPSGYDTAEYAAPQHSTPLIPQKLSVVGLIGLGLAVLGAVVVCIPSTVIVGGAMLGLGFVASLVSLFLTGKKWPGIVGLILSVVAGFTAIVVALVLTLVGTVERYAPEFADASASDTDSDSDSDRDREVVEGELGSAVTITQYVGTAEVTLTSATWSNAYDALPPPENGGLLTINMTWTGVEGTTSLVPIVYFRVETAEGEEGWYDPFAENQPQNGPVKPKQTESGVLTFDVAESSSYTVIITDEGLEDIARIEVTPSAG